MRHDDLAGLVENEVACLRQPLEERAELYQLEAELIGNSMTGGRRPSRANNR
jgi:hypothetical protein